MNVASPNKGVYLVAILSQQSVRVGKEAVVHFGRERVHAVTLAGGIRADPTRRL